MTRLTVELRDGFWAPRVDQLRTHTLGVVQDRLERQGSFDAFRRRAGRSDGPRRSLHFSDSDVYKWLEAAVLADRLDLAEETIELIEAVQEADGYVHTHYGAPDGPARYTDLGFGHEQYCAGHLIEAAVTHHEVTGSDRLLAVAVGLADHLLATFGPGRDERVDAHPEVELALCRLAQVTADPRYVDHAAWIIGRHLAVDGATLEEHRLGGHAVRALYLASGITEVAIATGDDRWAAAARQLFDDLLDQHVYPTGAVGGRWLGEAVGKPFEQPDALAYAESCAAVAAAQLCWRRWRLDRDPRALDQLELLLFNAVPAGVGAEGDTWFYSQPQAVAEVAADVNPWVYDFDYGMQTMKQWFPARRHQWFDVACCPPNLARLFAAVDRHVAEVTPDGDLLVHLPLAARIVGDGWDVEVGGRYPDDGRIEVTVHAAPDGRTVRLRRPGWAGGDGHQPLPGDGGVDLPVDWAWWTTDHRVEGGATVHLRRGPVVFCVEGVDHPGLDLRDLVVDPTVSPDRAFARRLPHDRPAGLHRRVTPDAPATEPVAVTVRPYADWANRGPSTMRLRFPLSR